MNGPKQNGKPCGAHPAECVHALRSAGPERFDRRAAQEMLFPYSVGELLGVIEKGLDAGEPMSGDRGLKRHRRRGGARAIGRAGCARTRRGPLEETYPRDEGQGEHEDRYDKPTGRSPPRTVVPNASAAIAHTKNSDDRSDRFVCAGRPRSR